MNLRIDGDRLYRELHDLGAISSEPAPVVTRVVFSEADLRARRFIRTLCSETELVVREDPVGNTFARWPGSEPALPPVGTGSHIDAIPNAGLFSVGWKRFALSNVPDFVPGDRSSWSSSPRRSLRDSASDASGAA
jgi:acetylornithine deacetylase/succinyl-diaminopimelate desuccinylase-like protein